MYNDLEKILFTEEQIQTRIKEIAAQIDKDYAGETPVVVGILKGCFMFFADLVRQMKTNIEIDFMSISSYGNNTKSSGEVKMIKDLDRTIEGRHVIIIEDIIDTGYTLKYLMTTLSARNPKSIKLCTLLDKKSRREVDISPDYVCFDVGDEFVVGYGLDYAQLYRNLPVIGVLKESVYKK
ncbi:MAG: hypoxanthine phosphoribosyltransferase [Clostridia bacterium]|nr:hypoxanthine phosphoribosyltransferase [Clostridia bacterium]MBQ3495403.1 hypoxanthine phosphoribosyltransferase [Clostridia bacterium]MBQ4586909.1 hypoxanthine phosphoribosyltransferase [Clostridia bacterium]